MKGSLRFTVTFELLSSSAIFFSSLLLYSQQTSSARGGLLPGNRPECMIKTLISNLSPGRLMWLISSDAPRSSCGGPEHSGFTHAKLIFTVKWDIWFTGRRPASSSNSSSNASRILQNCTYLSFFFFLPSCMFSTYCANLPWHRIKPASSERGWDKRIWDEGIHHRFVKRQWLHLLRSYKQVSSFSSADMHLCT